jgi:hypothetical protein
MNQTNVALDMMSVQGAADSKFDPSSDKVKPTVPAKIETFCNSDSLSVTLGSIGLLLIVYGLITK